MANEQSNTIEASKSWRVLECNPRWGKGLDRPATGRDVYIEIDGTWGDAGKDARLLEAAPQLLEALQELATFDISDGMSRYEMKEIARKAVKAGEETYSDRTT